MPVAERAHLFLRGKIVRGITTTFFFDISFICYWSKPIHRLIRSFWWFFFLSFLILSHMYHSSHNSLLFFILPVLSIVAIVRCVCFFYNNHGSPQTFVLVVFWLGDQPIPIADRQKKFRIDCVIYIYRFQSRSVFSVSLLHLSFFLSPRHSPNSTQVKHFFVLLFTTYPVAHTPIQQNIYSGVWRHEKRFSKFDDEKSNKR